jgi:D-xylose transport system ATP-binding protein
MMDAPPTTAHDPVDQADRADDLADRGMREAPVLNVLGVSKRFGAVEALVECTLEVYPGEIVALVGDNAAGKSTLAKIIAGVLQPDGGYLEIDGAPATMSSPAAARQHGVAAVFQSLGVCDNLDVTANVFLGQERSRRGLLDQHGMETTTREVLALIGANVPSLRTPVGRLSGGQRQGVAIARTMLGEPRVVVLDEPTASLGVVQTAEVLTHLDRLRSLGIGVLVIGHNLNDLRAVADRIEVLRHGRNNGSFHGPTSRNEEIIGAITGATRR